MADDDLFKLIGGIISLFVLAILAIYFLTAMSGLQCQSYKDTIAGKDNEIAQLKLQLNTSSQNIYECNNRYDQLIKENITKKDIEDIKNYYNQTQLEINYLNQRFDTVNNNFVRTYNTFFTQYKFSIAINLFFLVDLISFAFFKLEIVTYLFGLVFRKTRGLFVKQTHQVHQEVHLHGRQ